MTQDELYEAFVAAGPDGLAIADVNRLHQVDLSRRLLPTERANAGRHLRALTDAGVVEPVTHGRWRAVGPEGWVSGDPVPERASKPLPRVRPGVDLSVEQHHEQIARPWQVKRTERVEIDPELVGLMTDEERLAWRLYQVRNCEDDWRAWIPALFPSFASSPFGPHHAEFWEHVWSIQPGQPAPPFVAVWPRAQGKSAGCEMAAVALGIRGVRRYCIYISLNQELADHHVASVATLLQSDMVSMAYPSLGERKMDSYGHSKGWKRNRLHTEDGFVVDALGLDVATRGKRIDEQRPDLFIIDDVDSHEDTPLTVQKKIRALTRKILPAGSQDVAVLAVQNKVHPESIFARLSSRNQPGEPEPADFMANRIVSGPHPAVRDLKWVERYEDDGRKRYIITGGEPTWEGMPIAACQHQLDTFGIAGFLAEFQHDEPDLDGGMFGHLDFSDGGPIRVSEAEVPTLVRKCVWVDPAVSKTDQSDSCGVTVAGLGTDRRYYFLWSYEQRATPLEALTVAVNASVEFGCDVLGVETDQGGDTWKVIYQQVLAKVMDKLTEENGGQLPEGVRMPRYEYAKAGSAQMSKMDRLDHMRAEYDLGRIKHVGSGAHVLERGLKRFPRYPPLDAADSSWHAWNYLATKGRGNPNQYGGVRTRAARGIKPPLSPQGLPGAR